MQRREVNEIITVNTNESIEYVREIFTKNVHETIFVTNKKGYLHGVITIGDFLKRTSLSKQTGELMNKNFIRICMNGKENTDSLMKKAKMIFENKGKAVEEIPIVAENGVLLYTIREGGAIILGLKR